MSAEKLDKELAAYSVAAGVVLAGVGNASADIQFTEVDLTVDNTTIYLDVNGDSVNDLMLSQSNDSGSAFYAGGFVAGSNGAQIANYRSYSVWNFSKNQLISDGAGSSWVLGAYFFMNYMGVGGTASYQAFSPASPGYIGFRFDPAGGSNWNYGWLHVDDVAGDWSSYHVSGYAYEDNGSPISAGAVPEPSSIALLALGAAGIRALRRFNRPGA